MGLFSLWPMLQLIRDYAPIMITMIIDDGQLV